MIPTLSSDYPHYMKTSKAAQHTNIQQIAETFIHLEDKRRILIREKDQEQSELENEKPPKRRKLNTEDHKNHEKINNKR